MTTFRPFGLLLIIVVGVLFFSSCSDKSKKAPVLPSDCALVLKIDTWEVAKKSAIYELRDTPIYKEIINGLKKTKRDELIPFIENPMKTGFDVLEPIYAFVARDDEAGSSLIGIRANVSNQNKFTEFIKTILKTNPLPVPVLQMGEISYFMTNQWILAWEKSDVLFLFQEKVEQRVLLEKAVELIANKKDGANMEPDFVKFHARHADVSLWFNYSQFSDEIAKLQKYIIDIDVPKDQFLHFYVDFEQGGVNTSIRWNSPSVKDNMLKHVRKKIEENPQYLLKIL
jgi:hypothetical protein